MKRLQGGSLGRRALAAGLFCASIACLRGMGNPLEVSGPLFCADDTWTASSNVNAPGARAHHTAVWTGSEVIIWGGGDLDLVRFNTGAKYDPATNNWSATSTTNTPSRGFHTAVWTGSEMIVWGGYGSSPSDVDTGGRYNPLTIAGRYQHGQRPEAPRWPSSAVWTGREMIVWGGAGCEFGNCRSKHWWQIRSRDQ